jgi:hypothetical protein
MNSGTSRLTCRSQFGLSFSDLSIALDSSSPPSTAINGSESDLFGSRLAIQGDQIGRIFAQWVIGQFFKGFPGRAGERIRDFVYYRISSLYL